MIRIKNVCAGYGDKEVLHNVSLDFKRGKVTVIIGPNGCGKSTLLRTLVRMNKHRSGEILLEIANGEEIPVDRLTTAEMAQQVAFLPQSKRTPDIGVLRMVLHGRFAHLKYPRRYRREDYEIARNALRRLDIEDLEMRNLNELSGGTKQQVYIAMALAQDTDTILLDEPTTYLDIAHQIKTMKLMKELTSHGKTIIMVLHDLVHAFQIADQIVVMESGRVACCGEPEEIYQSSMIEKIFDVKLKRMEIDGEWKYFIC